MADKKSALAEFKDFILQGNVIDLAVAVVIAMFFGAVVKDVVNLILSLIAIPGNTKRSFDTLTFTIGHGVFAYGVLISDLITFIIVAFVVFFAVVRPVGQLLEKRRTQPDAESTNRPCPFCKSDIPKEATRCAFCTSEVSPVSS